MQRIQQLAGVTSAPEFVEGDDLLIEGNPEDEEERMLEEVLRLSRMEFENDEVAAVQAEEVCLGISFPALCAP